MNLRYSSMCVVLLSMIASAATKHHFDADPERVYSALKASIQSRGCVISEDSDTKAVQFQAAHAGGFAQTNADAGGSLVTINISGNVLFGGAQKTEQQIIHDIAGFLAGREMKVDPRKIEKCQARAAKAERSYHNDAAPTAVPPASCSISSSLSQVKSALIAESAARGFVIIGETEHSLTISRVAPAPQDLSWFVSELVIGRLTPRAYRAEVQFMLAEQQNGGIAVTSASAIAAVNGYGGMASLNVSNNSDAQHAVQSLLDAAKARLH